VRIAVLGGGPGGPGGLLTALLAKRGDPAHEVTVFERNQAGDTFGFGVVFSDAQQISLGAIADGLAAAGVAKFKWPERLEIVAELPVTKMGKLDKKALRDRLGRSTA
jgi:non-ribosomal peptide synthetase component E (peptide arylation enzyme)